MPKLFQTRRNLAPISIADSAEQESSAGAGSDVPTPLRPPASRPTSSRGTVPDDRAAASPAAAVAALRNSVPFKPLEVHASDYVPDSLSLQTADRSVELIVPSLSYDEEIRKSMAGIQLYEERALWNLAKNGPTAEGKPPIRQAMVLSQPFHPATFEYILQLLAGIPASQAKDRLIYFMGDASDNALSRKLLGSPEFIERLRNVWGDADAHLLCFMVTEDEGALAEALGIPLRANSPELKYWGTKPGSRAIFAEAEIPHPDGTPECRSLRELAEKTAELLEKYPDAEKLVIKLSDGTSGDGNAILDLRPMRDTKPASRTEMADELEKILPTMKLMGEKMTWPIFESKIAELGVLSEMFVDGKVKTSPSVQGTIHPDGRVEILSTHEQVLGGDDGQIYLGARFPADDVYRTALQDYGRRAGEALAAKGAEGRFAMDFMAVERGSGSGVEWDLQAIEINLREGGTTHPYHTTQVLTGGALDEATGLFLAPDGTPKFYTASDNIQSDRYKGLTAADAADIAHKHGLHYDPETQTGIAFHMLSLLRDLGKVGVTCIGNSPEEAEKLFEDTKKALESEMANAPATTATAAETPPAPPVSPVAKPKALFLTGNRQILLRPKEGVFTDWMRAAAFSPDRSSVAVAINRRGDYSVRINDRKTGEELTTLTGPTLPIRDVAFGPKSWVAAGSADGSVTVWDASKGQTRWSDKNGGMVNAVAFSPSGKYLAAVKSHGGLAVWDAESGKQVLKSQDRNSWARSVTFSPDGEMVAAGFADGTVRLRNVESGEELPPLKGHGGGAYDVSFSDDGRLLAVTGGNGSISIWHVKEHKLLHRLDRENWKTGKAAFAPGGERLAFGSTDGSVRLYDWKSGTETKIRDFDSTPTSLKQEFQLGPVQWTEGGRTITGVSANGTLREWSLA